MTSNYLKPVNELGYDPSSQSSVVAHAKKLLNKSLNEVLASSENLSDRRKVLNKGAFGQVLEELYFNIKNNSDAQPDVPECGVEIKSAQIIVAGNSKKFKERLKITALNYSNSFNYENLFESPLWAKLEKILLMLFIYQADKNRMDDLCDWADILNFPEDDIVQFAEDWNLIKEKVLSGKADEITEGMTLYLGASTAGKDSNDLVLAPGNIKAKRRAFSLKNSYLNELFSYRPPKLKSQIGKIRQGKKSLEKSIVDEANKFKGRTCEFICNDLGIDFNRFIRAKDSFSRVSRHISNLILSKLSGAKSGEVYSQFEELNKAGIRVKTIVLEKNGQLKEAMSFPTIKWKDLHGEKVWEDSDLYQAISGKFLFYVYQKTDEDNNPKFLRAFFWTISEGDLEKMKNLWLDTKEKISNNDYENFIKSSEHDVGHIRPHGRDSKDLCETPQGSFEKKKSFWFNRSYILDVVKNNLD